AGRGGPAQREHGYVMRAQSLGQQPVQFRGDLVRNGAAARTRPDCDRPAFDGFRRMLLRRPSAEIGCGTRCDLLRATVRLPQPVTGPEQILANTPLRPEGLLGIPESPQSLLAGKLLYQQPVVVRQILTLVYDDGMPGRVPTRQG